MRSFILQIAKAVACAVITSLAFVLIFSFFVLIFSLSDSVIKPVCQVFKILSIVLGGMLFIRNERGLVKGCIYGAITVLITFFLFGIISGSLTFSWKFPLEILLGALAGGISGVLVVNFKNRKR
jgi:putative membrane protein (TIGR04086 family)